MGIAKHWGYFCAITGNFFIDDSSIQTDMYIIKTSAPNSFFSYCLCKKWNFKKIFEPWKIF